MHSWWTDSATKGLKAQAAEQQAQVGLPSRRAVARREDTHPPLARHPLAEAAIESFLAGVSTVDPTVLVRKAVRQGLLDDWFEDRMRPKPLHVLALGKAAPRMLWGLVEAGVPFSGIGAAPKGVPAPNVDTFRWLPGEHPLPGAGSFAAGSAILAWADALPENAPVLVLLSGGASACAESPLHGSEQELVRQWQEWLAQGLGIVELNQRRARLSALKGGRLGLRLLGRTRRVRCWLLSDVPAAHPESVGSGPVWVEDKEPGAVPHLVLADGETLLQGAAYRLAILGFQVHRHPGRLQGGTAQQVEAFLDGAAALPAGDVALLGIGETADPMPALAPPEGRMLAAALAAAVALRRRGDPGLFCALASDGRDGATAEAGAWATADDGDRQAQEALGAWAAHAVLASRGRTVRTGATGTNVNDLWAYLRRGPATTALK